MGLGGLRLERGLWIRDDGVEMVSVPRCTIYVMRATTAFGERKWGDMSSEDEYSSDEVFEEEDDIEEEEVEIKVEGKKKNPKGVNWVHIEDLGGALAEYEVEYKQGDVTDAYDYYLMELEARTKEILISDIDRADWVEWTELLVGCIKGDNKFRTLQIREIMAMLRSEAYNYKVNQLDLLY